MERIARAVRAERIGIVGSRKGVDLGLVRAFVATLHAEQSDTIVVSGGADGVDTTAEQAWLALGGAVQSFRTFKVTRDSWGVKEWRLGIEPAVIDHVIPTFADPKSALFFRNTMIVEASDRLVSFTNRRYSPGTKFTKYVAEGVIPVYEMVA